MRKTVVVMLKEPRAGRVKTRLGRDIGMTQAAWWFRHQTRALLRRIADRRWQVVLAISPDAALKTSAFARRFDRMPQGRGDLGARMARVMRRCPPGPVVIIGGDIPGIQTSHLAAAFGALGRNEAVFGPALDGGYWLVGLHRTRIPAGAFQGVRWSSPNALGDTINSLGRARVALIDTLSDVDTAADLSA